LKLSSEQKSEERETQNRFRSEEHTQPQNKNGDETHKPESKFLLHKNQTRFTYNHERITLPPSFDWKLKIELLTHFDSKKYKMTTMSLRANRMKTVNQG
jgi:hypothetical protein